MLHAILILLLILSSGEPALTLTWPKGPSNGKADGVFLSINMWNVAEANGTAIMKYYDNGSIIFKADLWNLKIKDRKRWVLGYPEAYYGYNPWSGVWVQGSLKLPVEIGEMPQIEVTVNYTLSKPAELPLNFAYDIWITKERFSQGVGPKDYELMIWLYSDKISPAGINVLNTTLPINLNGEELSNKWEFWVAKETGRWLVATLKSSKPLIGMVKMDLKRYIHAFLNTLKSMKIEAPTYKYNVEDIELGSEFGSPFTKKANFNWKITLFTITGNTASTVQTIDMGRPPELFGNALLTATVIAVAVTITAALLLMGRKRR